MGVYLYRAVDKAGNTVDFRLSDRRNVAAAKAFFKQAIRHQGHAPHTYLHRAAVPGLGVLVRDGELAWGGGKIQ